MITLSKMYDWEGNPDVKRRIVFSSEYAEGDFMEKYRQKCKRLGIPLDPKVNNGFAGIEAEMYSIEKDCGAFAFLIAAKNHNGNWKYLLRDGYGHLIQHSQYDYRSPEMAITKALRNLSHIMLRIL